MVDQKSWEEGTAHLHVGDIVMGRIVTVFQSGLYVDIGAPEMGLIHLINVSDDRDKRSTSEFEAGMDIYAVIVEIDDIRHMIALSLNDSVMGLKDHWDHVINDNYIIGHVLEGFVIELAPEFVLVRSDSGVNCVIKLDASNNPHWNPQRGANVRVKVIDQDLRNLRLIGEFLP